MPCENTTHTEVAPLVATQLEAAKAGEKTRRKLELELAAYQGKELYSATAPAADGLRRAVQRLERGNLEDLRAVAQNFTAQSKSVFVATLKDPPSVLMAASADSGVDAGALLKAALNEAGGRGAAGRIGGEDHRELNGRRAIRDSNLK